MERPIGMVLALGIDPGIANTGVAAVGVAGDGDGAHWYQSRGGRHIWTQKDQTKHLRRGTDDARRLCLIVREVSECIAKVGPACVGVEQYTVYEPPWVGKIQRSGRQVADCAAVVAATGLAPREAFCAAAESAEWVASWAKAMSGMEAALEASGARGGIGLGQAAKTLMVWGAVVALCAMRGVAVYVFTPADVKRRVGCGGRAKGSKQDVLDWCNREILEFKDDVSRWPKGSQNHVSDAAVLAILAAEAHGPGGGA